MADPTGLAVGDYSGLITIAASSGTGGTQIIEVTLSVTGGPRPIVTAVVNAASYQSRAIAPGEVLTVFGSGIGPPSSIGMSVGADGFVSNLLSDARVLFDGTAAPLLSVFEGQLSAVAPYWLSGKSTIQMEVEYKGERSNAVILSVSEASPGIFTTLPSGRGIFNEDGSINSPANPASRGSIIVLYATGEGQKNPPGIDGKIAKDVLPKPTGLVSVQIQGIEAELVYVGAAPYTVAGILQINAHIPDTVATSAAAPIILSIAGTNSQSNLTVAVP